MCCVRCVRCLRCVRLNGNRALGKGHYEMMGGVCLPSVSLSVWRMPRPNLGSVVRRWVWRRPSVPSRWSYRYILYYLFFSRVNGPSTRLVETRARHGPCRRVMETGHPSTRAVNSGSENRALGPRAVVGFCPPPRQLEGLRSAVSSPAGSVGGSPAEIEFGAF